MENAEMKERRIRSRSIAVLIFAVVVAVAGWSAPVEARARQSSAYNKLCYYGTGIYSLGACRGGQRCVRGVNDEDYWEDDADCDQTSPGSGGIRQV
jgi:hypothetical protein